MRTISDEISCMIPGRPARFGSNVHFRAMRCRCHRRIVSGVTTVATCRKTRRPAGDPFAALVVGQSEAAPLHLVLEDADMPPERSGAQASRSVAPPVSRGLAPSQQRAKEVHIDPAPTDFRLMSPLSDGPAAMIASPGGVTGDDGNRSQRSRTTLGSYGAYNHAIHRKRQGFRPVPSSRLPPGRHGRALAGPPRARYTPATLAMRRLG
jgi:hypothetical protein